MKKIMVLFMLTIMLLTGCEKEVKPIEDEQIVEETVSLMDEAIPVEGMGNIVYIPNEYISGSWYPNIYALGENLLVVSYPEYYEGDESQTQEMPNVEFRLVSLKTGEVLKEIDLSYIMGEIQVWGDKVAICDSQIGLVTILDSNLEKEIEFQVEPDPMESWFICEDLETLYICDWDEGLAIFDLMTGKKEQILEYGVDAYMTKDANGNMFCHYTDLATQKNTAICFNLKTGMSEQVPLESDVGYDCSKYGDAWLVSSVNDVEKYYLCEQGIEKEIPYEGNGIQLLGDKLLLVKERGASLYDMSGTFLSGFELPEESLNFVNNQLVWNEYWNGYFLIENRDDGPRLLFWDVNKQVQGMKLTIEEPVAQVGEAVSLELYERANEISECFGVDIRIADLCEESYAEYTCAYEVDEEEISFALDMLEDYMQNYPEGFFEQLTYGDHGPLEIALVTELQRDDGVEPSAAFVWGHIMVFDSLSVTEANFYHEVSHIIDQKLAFDAALYDEASYSEETWLSMQPEGFDYTYTYADYYLNEVDYDYFVTSYSATFPTEDRAELMDYAMRDVVEFEEGTGLYAKLEYYSHCIRECFDTVGWPMITMWEEPLYM